MTVPAPSQYRCTQVITITDRDVGDDNTFSVSIQVHTGDNNNRQTHG